MKYIGFLVSLIITITLVYFLDQGVAGVPPMGKLLSPYTGFWQNAEGQEPGWPEQEHLNGLQNEVQVFYDDRRVPHVVAANDHDLYFMQGYLTARDRLFEMEFITRVAAGRLSELFGDVAVEFDRSFRRLGLAYAAEQAVGKMDDDPVMKAVMEAYAAGVNAYISSLTYKDYPVEYKLTNTKPEAWVPLKSALLLKFMALNLTGRDYDFEYTNFLNKYGLETFNILYPNKPEGLEPIIPSGTEYSFDSIPLDTPQYRVPAGMFAYDEHSRPLEKNIGSNNWAVSGSKTSTGKPILCNDPHLQLYAPSIWYEMELNGVYGVTLPGSPCIIIGFNDEVAWGVTNAGMDVRDWYAIQYSDASRTKYLIDGQPVPLNLREEVIHVKGGQPFIDTVRYTAFGPIVYDEEYKQYSNATPLALQWTAHEPSNELRTFFMLNRASDYNDYREALKHYHCPAQNFVFATTTGDIAITQQGKLPKKWPGQGRFVQDGSTAKYLWQGYIPMEHNPTIKNPERGFVSSANQHPTDTAYPYFYNGYYEYDRNRRLNEVLQADSLVTVEDVMALQNDNYSYRAKDLLPFLLESLTQDNRSLYNNEVKQLYAWDYMYDVEKSQPVMFDLIYEELEDFLWDELLPEDTMAMETPDAYVTIQLLKLDTNNVFMDNKSTPKRENSIDVMNVAFAKAMERFAALDTTQWWLYKGTQLQHWVPLLKSFGSDKIKVGGGRHILNANSERHGASWRMVVSMEEPVKAWVVYPGGQSGNPGSHRYHEFVAYWANGQYYEVTRGTQQYPYQFTYKPAP